MRKGHAVKGIRTDLMWKAIAVCGGCLSGSSGPLCYAEPKDRVSSCSCHTDAHTSTTSNMDFATALFSTRVTLKDFFVAWRPELKTCKGGSSTLNWSEK